MLVGCLYLFIIVYTKRFFVVTSKLTIINHLIALRQTVLFAADKRSRTTRQIVFWNIR